MGNPYLSEAQCLPISDVLEELSPPVAEVLV
jgi:hypothetical protein